MMYFKPAKGRLQTYQFRPCRRMEAAVSSKRDLAESSEASTNQQGPAAKIAKLPPPEFKVPQAKVSFAAGTSGGAAAAAAGGGGAHSNAQVGLRVDFDGGYRDSATGRWVGNGSWARLWDGIDTGSWTGSHYYGVPESQQAAAAREASARNQAASASASAAE